MQLKIVDKILSKCVKLENGCLQWQGAFQLSGKQRQLPYPSIHHEGRTTRGNRLVYSLFYNKEIKRNEHICHTCDNSKCLNPEHLFMGSHVDNMQDKIRKNRDHNLKKTHCKNGHPFDGENLIMRKSGARSCRVCMRKYWNNYDAKNRDSRRILALQRYHEGKEVKDDTNQVD